MLLRQETLRRIRDGEVRLAFRRWKRPTIRAGGTLMTSIGVLAIERMDAVDPAAITEADARAAGYADPGALLDRLGSGPGTVFRIALRLAGPDPRIALRETIPATREALDAVLGRLARWDAAGRDGSWTLRALSLLAAHPGVRAAALAPRLGFETPVFKRKIRQLQSLGLTESLGTGYRLSPRGEAVLAAMTPPDGPPRAPAPRGGPSAEG